MTNQVFRSTLPWLLLTVGGFASLSQDEMTDEPTGGRVHYLEFVTPEVDATCATYAQLHGLTFSDPVPELGNARTATRSNGGIIAVRAPLRDDEEPVVRPYLLVDDIEAAASATVEASGEIGVPPMEIPGRGKFAIYLLGGIDHGLWQL